MAAIRLVLVAVFVVLAWCDADAEVARSPGSAKVVSFVQAVKKSFFDNPLHAVERKESDTLVDYLSYLSKRPECANKPIAMSMARVQSPLYWQLIEGFFHSMFYFDHLSCSVMICVTGKGFAVRT